MIMKTVASALIGLSLMAAMPASASAECVLEGWVEGSSNHPIFKCSDPEASESQGHRTHARHHHSQE